MATSNPTVIIQRIGNLNPGIELSMNGTKVVVPDAWHNYKDDQKQAVINHVVYLKRLWGMLLIQVHVIRVFPRRVAGRYAGWRVDANFVTR